MLAEEGRRALNGGVAVGLVPLLVQRVGELAVTYLFPLAEAPTPGQVLDLPQQFVTGPLLLWLAFKEGPAPNWLAALSGRVNLATLWSVAIWADGLRSLDGRGWTPWHVGLPLFALAISGLVTWLFAPTAYSLILGTP